MDNVTSRRRGASGTGRGRAVLVASISALVLPLGACGISSDPQDTPAVTSSAIARIGQITVADVEFLFHPPIAGDEVYAVGSTAPMSATIVNHGRDADRLTRVSSPVATGALLVGDMKIPGRQSLTAGQEGFAAIETRSEDGDNVIALTGVKQPLRSGLTYPVTFGFEHAGDVVLDVPVDTPDIPRRERADDNVLPPGN